MEGEMEYYSGYTLEREVSNFIEVWLSAVVSLCYCYFSAKFVPKGVHPNLPDEDGPCPRFTQKGRTSIWSYAIKGVLAVLLIIHASKYGDHMHPKLMLVLICIQIYFSLEIILATAAATARALFGMELEPPFVKPHLSTSVQNFWGRRWNLVASRSLRSTVYEPALCVSVRLIGRKWASLPAVMCTFVVSALMHEIVFYNMGRLQPTWEITWFFLLHGACVVVEIWMKKVVKDGWQLPRLIGTPMTLGFVMVTVNWLFLPQLFRCKMFVRASEEYALLGAFVKELVARVAKSSTWIQ